jgi:hypothetical protein
MMSMKAKTGLWTQISDNFNEGSQKRNYDGGVAEGYFSLEFTAIYRNVSGDVRVAETGWGAKGSAV